MRETADIPTGITQEQRDRAARRITRNVLDVFWEDIEGVCCAPFLQILGRCGYNEVARRSRDRIAADQAEERNQARRLNAA